MILKKLLPVAVVGVVALAGCGSNHCTSGGDCSREDALDTRDADNTAPRVILFNNHYPNIETKCDGHGHRIYVGTHDSAKGNNIQIIPDPSCDGWTRDTALGIVPTGGR